MTINLLISAQRTEITQHSSVPATEYIQAKPVHPTEATEEFEAEPEYGSEEGLEEEWESEEADADIDADIGTGTEEFGEEELVDFDEPAEGEAMDFEDFENLPEFDDD